MKRVVILMMISMGSLAYAAGPAKVLLLPFDSAGPAEKQWISKALQQNLLAELSRVNSVEPVLGAQVANTIDAALKAAQDAGAQFVVFGSYQAIDADLRMTGQVIDVATKQPVAGLKSTGTQRDLFGMEDVIANQVKRALPQPIAQAKPEMLQQPPAQPAPPPFAPPQVNVNLQANELEQQIDRAIDRLRFATDYDDSFYYPNTYFNSGYYSPYYTYPVYIYPRFRHHHHFGGLLVSGSFHGHNFSGSFSTGGSFGQSVTSSPTGNYNSFGRMTMQSPGGSSRR